MEKRKKVELLAPAGNAEGFYGAIRAGADAVYLGGSRFGARAYAENFTTEELLSCIRYSRILGRKLYLTVNTLLKEQELPALYDYLAPFYEAGLDGVIVQDLGVLGFIREHFPSLAIHASTQMTLCSRYGTELLKSLGAERIVPARELSLEELRVIKKDTDIELETFVHGAMCYCYSGQCLFSSILGGRSGNRGRCAQPCRLPYSVESPGRKPGGVRYPLSLKDMCTIAHIPDLIEAGIDSFKIEGRMKKPEYAAGVTAIYRKYIDSYYEKREHYGKEEAKRAFSVSFSDQKTLSSLYIRSELQDGYYFRRNGKEMVTAQSPAYSGSDDRLLEGIRKEYMAEPLRMPVQIEASFLTGRPAQVSLHTKQATVRVSGETVQAAQKQPITEENIRKQLGRLGESCFSPDGMLIAVSEDAFYPLKQINELRRKAVLLLEQELAPARTSGVSYQPSAAAEARRTAAETADTAAATAEAAGAETATAETERIIPMGELAVAGTAAPHGYVVLVSTVQQLKALADWLKRHPACGIERLYVDGDLAAFQEKETLSLCGELPGDCRLFLAFPYVLREADEAYLEKLYALVESGRFQGFLLRSLDALGFLAAKGGGELRRSDAGLYVWNSAACRTLADAGVRDGFCIPYELKAGEQYALLDNAAGTFEKIVYSRIPMMAAANCVVKTTARCENNGIGTAVLTDRYQNRFPVVRNCHHCMNIIYNSVPLSLWQGRDKWRRRADLRLDFTLEDERETEAILDAFLLGREMPAGRYTNGHEKRGVE